MSTYKETALLLLDMHQSHVAGRLISIFIEEAIKRCAELDLNCVPYESPERYFIAPKWWADWMKELGFETIVGLKIVAK